MQIAIITDEYSQDPATAFELGKRWGVELFEIRQAYRFRVPVAPAWAADRVVAAARDYGVKISAISPGLFKPTMRTDGSGVPISDQTPSEVRRHLDELLPSFFAFAERLGTRNINVFALPRSTGGTGFQPVPALVTDSLSEAADKARQRGFALLLENVGSSWADSAEATLAILSAVNSPALRLCWDPANVAVTKLSPDPVRLDYPRLKGYLGSVHVKDVSFTAGRPRWAMIGEGVVDWPEQFRLLRADGFAGPLTLEPHWTFQPGEINLVASVERLLAKVRELAG